MPVTIPYSVVEKIREAAKERGEEASGWCRATAGKAVRKWGSTDEFIRY